MTNTGSPRQRKVRARMDAAKAFDLAGDMEEPLANLGRIARSLRLLISAANDGSENVADALYLLADLADEASEKVENIRCEIWQRTWGYRYPDREQKEEEPWDAELITRMEATLRDQKEARRKLDEARAKNIHSSEGKAA